MTSEVIDRAHGRANLEKNLWRQEVCMREGTITGLILVVAVIHLAPIRGFLGASRLEALYGVSITSPELEILMRHRAMLFGILGGFLAYAAFTPALQPLAFLAAGVSLAAFFYLDWSVGSESNFIRRIAIADAIASVCLLGAIVLYVLS